VNVCGYYTQRLPEHKSDKLLRYTICSVFSFVKTIVKPAVTLHLPLHFHLYLGRVLCNLGWSKYRTPTLICLPESRLLSLSQFVLKYHTKTGSEVPSFLSFLPAKRSCLSPFRIFHPTLPFISLEHTKYKYASREKVKKKKNIPYREIPWDNDNT
jgi:hypothetical protein